MPRFPVSLHPSCYPYQKLLVVESGDFEDEETWKFERSCHQEEAWAGMEDFVPRASQGRLAGSGRWD
jgi:hypothetical protein